MARETYKDINFGSATLELIDLINLIIEQYQAAGFKLTVRQVYYQLVARDVLPNTERSYKRITGIVNDARLAGLMDWDAIEDRTREFIVRQRWESGAQILDHAARGFHMDAWVGQKARAFVIIEKEALVGLLEPACQELDVPLLAARGYPSGTVLREFCEDHIIPATNAGQATTIFHLGDHDPSGIDMSRDLEERLDMFCYNVGPDLQRIALNMDQIKRLKPPPNPAKVTDSRFASYQQKYGDESWELDALKPEYLDRMVRAVVATLIDPEVWSARQEEIFAVRDKLQEMAGEFA